MGATNVVTSTDTAGIGYYCQEQPAHPRAITTTGDDHCAPNTLQVDAMTGEARADPMLGYTRETEVKVTQDTPAQTGTLAGTEMPDHHRTQSRSPHRQQPSNNRPLTPYTRHNSRSRSSSGNNNKPHR